MSRPVGLGRTWFRKIMDTPSSRRYTVPAAPMSPSILPTHRQERNQTMHRLKQNLHQQLEVGDRHSRDRHSVSQRVVYLIRGGGREARTRSSRVSSPT